MSSRKISLLERARTEGAPLIEGNTATFVWSGKQAPILAGDMTGWRTWETASDGQQMKQIASGVWTYSLPLPADAYMEYAYFLDSKRVGDPFNRHQVPNGFGDTNHCFWMPVAPHSPLFRSQKGVIPGTVSKQLFESLRLAGGKRTVQLYRPAVDGPYILLVVLDGKDYFQRARLTTLVDNLIFQGSLPPLAIAFLDNARQSRFAEYGCSEALVGFVDQELLPWVANQVPLVKKPGAHGVLGASLGGLAALWLGVRLPQTFGKVFSQAGGFALGSSKELGLTTLLRLGERLPLRIYLDCGRFDPLLKANRMLKGLLKKRGYDLAYHEFNAGHNYPAWREELPAGLTWLFQ